MRNDLLHFYSTTSTPRARTVRVDTPGPQYHLGSAYIVLSHERFLTIRAPQLCFSTSPGSSRPSYQCTVLCCGLTNNAKRVSLGRTQLRQDPRYLQRQNPREITVSGSAVLGTSCSHYLRQNGVSCGRALTYPIPRGHRTPVYM